MDLNREEMVNRQVFSSQYSGSLVPEGVCVHITEKMGVFHLFSVLDIRKQVTNMLGFYLLHGF